MICHRTLPVGRCVHVLQCTARLYSNRGQQRDVTRAKLSRAPIPRPISHINCSKGHHSTVASQSSSGYTHTTSVQHSLSLALTALYVTLWLKPKRPANVIAIELWQYIAVRSPSIASYPACALLQHVFTLFVSTIFVQKWYEHNNDYIKETNTITNVHSVIILYKTGSKCKFTNKYNDYSYKLWK